MLPERFAIHITGTVSQVRTRHLITKNSLPHLLAELLAGTFIPPDAFAAFGLQVVVEEDTDQGPE